MIRLKTILTTTTLLLTLAGFGWTADHEPPQNIPGPQQKQLGNTDPEPNLDGVVEVSFKIDNLGKVQILNINSTSPQLSDYVIKKLGKIQLEEGNTQVGKVIKYRFVFKKQA